MLNPKKKKRKAVEHKPPTDELTNIHNALIENMGKNADNGTIPHSIVEEYYSISSSEPKNVPVKPIETTGYFDFSINNKMETILQQVLQGEGPSGRCNNIWKDEDW